MRDPEGYRGISAGLYAVYWMAAFFAAVTVTVLSSEVFDGGWGILFTILVGLVSLSTAMAGFDALRRRRSNGYFARRFPGYAGGRFPLFYLLRYEGPAGAVDFTESERVYSLGEAGDAFFLLRNRTSDTPHKLIGGDLVFLPRTAAPILLRKPDIVDVAVIERSDEEIAAGAVDRRDFTERLGSQIAQRLTGTSVKTKIVPFAAYVVVTTHGSDGEARLIAAVPTTISAETLKAIGDATAKDAAEMPWLMDKAVDGLKDAAVEEIDRRAVELVGEPVMDVVHGGADVYHEVTDAVGEVKSWLDPDAASIATTAGDRGRQMARYIGARIRMGVLGYRGEP